MKNTTLLNKLLRIEQNGCVNPDPDFLALLAEVKQEVYNEEKTFSSDQKRASKKALAFLTKIKKQNKYPFLAYCDFQEVNGSKKQVFTDSYILFALNTYYKLPTVEDLKKETRNENLTYPQVASMIPNENGFILENAKEKTEDILKKIKSKQYEKEKPFDSFHTGTYDVYFNVDKLKTIIEILGTSDLEVNIYGQRKPIKLTDKKTGNEAILIPINPIGIETAAAP